MTEKQVQVEILQEENRELKARVAELEAKLAERECEREKELISTLLQIERERYLSRREIKRIEREWYRLRRERERYHQLKALGGTV